MWKVIVFMTALFATINSASAITNITFRNTTTVDDLLGMGGFEWDASGMTVDDTTGDIYVGRMDSDLAIGFVKLNQSDLSLIANTSRNHINVTNEIFPFSLVSNDNLLFFINQDGVYPTTFNKTDFTNLSTEFSSGVCDMRDTRDAAITDNYLITLEVTDEGRPHLCILTPNRTFVSAPSGNLSLGSAPSAVTTIDSSEDRVAILNVTHLQIHDLDDTFNLSTPRCEIDPASNVNAIDGHNGWLYVSNGSIIKVYNGLNCSLKETLTFDFANTCPQLDLKRQKLLHVNTFGIFCGSKTFNKFKLDSFSADWSYPTQAPQPPPSFPSIGEHQFIFLNGSNDTYRSNDTISC